VLAFPQIDETLGKYRIISILGKGTTATVYRATHKFLSVDVALKVLSPKLISEDDSIRDRFLDEAMNHAKLTHNNFVRIIDVENEEKYTYIVMEYIDGAALDDILKVKGALPPLQVIRIFLEICKALKYAHDLNIIHRDIKPGNIMITRESEVKLADFGLAKSIDEPDKHQKNSGQIFGTPHYMSPEQFIDSAGIDHRSDLYSLGATIYHIVTGKLPFETESLPEIISMHLNIKPVPPEKISEQVINEFSEIIMKLLEKKPVDRYQNYLELIRDLEKTEQIYKIPPAVRKTVKEVEEVSESGMMKKFERYQKHFINFNENQDLSKDIVKELEQSRPENLDEQKLKAKILENLKRKAKDLSAKPNIDSYVSQNVKEYLKNIENESNDSEVSERLKQKYQKYFKQFNQGADLENVVMNSLNRSFSDAGYTTESEEKPVHKKEVLIELPENLKIKAKSDPINKKYSDAFALSKDFNQGFEEFSQKNNVKISASKYIQKFKKLFG
jgi:serine/threonine protein kinase